MNGTDAREERYRDARECRYGVQMGTGQFPDSIRLKYVISVSLSVRGGQKKRLLTAFVGCGSRASKKPINGETGAQIVRLRELSRRKWGIMSVFVVCAINSCFCCNL